VLRARGKSFLHGVGSYAKVRRGPDDASIPNQQGLRRLVTDTEFRRNGVRDVTVRLYCDDRVSRILHSCLDDIRVEVIDELIERLGADAARETVFEEQ